MGGLAPAVFSGVRPALGRHSTEIARGDALFDMPGVHIFWIILGLLRRHSRGIRNSRNTARAELGPRYVILRQARLAIVKLSVASVTRRHFGAPWMPIDPLAEVERAKPMTERLPVARLLTRL